MWVFIQLAKSVQAIRQLKKGYQRKKLWLALGLTGNIKGNITYNLTTLRVINIWLALKKKFY